METNSRPEATASPVKQGQYSPRKRKDMLHLRDQLRIAVHLAEMLDPLWISTV